MYGILLVSDLFVRMGYTVSAIIMLVWLVIIRKKNNSFLSSLASISNGILAFYALCYVLLFAYDYFTQTSYTKNSLLTILANGYLLIALAMAVPWIRRQALGVLLPFSILINAYDLYRGFTAPVIPGWHTQIYPGSFLLAVMEQKPYLLIVMIGCYMLLVLCLYQFYKWAKKFAEAPPSS
jgi:hypothetical protein